MPTRGLKPAADVESRFPLFAGLKQCYGMPRSTSKFVEMKLRRAQVAEYHDIPHYISSVMEEHPEAAMLPGEQQQVSGLAQVQRNAECGTWIRDFETREWWLLLACGSEAQRGLT